MNKIGALFFCLSVFSIVRASDYKTALGAKRKAVDSEILGNPTKYVKASNRVKLLVVTPDAENVIAYVARVSNPTNQENKNIAGLLKYCIKHKHWSIFEQVSMTLEIETSRAIATQILRHRSFSFQQFSQRYADNTLLSDTIPLPELRMQDSKNRQNSTDDLSKEKKAHYEERMNKIFVEIMALYQDMLKDGVAKECARFVLPEVMPAKMYMTGNIRSWIHYIELRSANGTQKEHMEVAEECKKIFIEIFPIIAEALGWNIAEESKKLEAVDVQSLMTALTCSSDDSEQNLLSSLQEEK